MLVSARTHHISGGAHFSYISYNSCLGKNKAKEKEEQWFPPLWDYPVTIVQKVCILVGKQTVVHHEHSPYSHLGGAAQESVCSNSEWYCFSLSNSALKHLHWVSTYIHLLCFQWNISGVKGNKAEQSQHLIAQLKLQSSDKPKNFFRHWV